MSNKDKKDIYGFYETLYRTEGESDADIGELMEDDWELYQEPQEPIDWEYIIKNKCLCWFGVIGKEKLRIGILKKISEFGECCTYYINDDDGFSTCRPVRRDEATFYEERK